MNSITKAARMAGFLYLGHFVTFFLADNGVHYTAVESVDVAAIAHNIVASERLFRILYSLLCFFSCRPGRYTCY